MRTLAFFLFFYLSYISLTAQTGILSGYVTDHESKPVNKAQVKMVDTDFSDITNEKGAFKIEHIPAGEYSVSVTKEGCRTIIIHNIIIEADKTTRRTFVLKADTGKPGSGDKSTRGHDGGSDDKPIGDKMFSEETVPFGTTGKKKEIDEEPFTEEEVSEIPASPRMEKVFSARSESRPAASGLKAGFADDNQQFNYFVNFLEKYKKEARHFPADIRERIHLKIEDLNHKSLPNTKISVFADKTRVASGKTFADGSFFFFPSMKKSRSKNYTLKITMGTLEKERALKRKGERQVVVTLDHQRSPVQQIPLDILFILDTTGSMGEEIQRLKNTIEIIQLNLTSMTPQPDVRFGMVLYKDKGDEYRTRLIPFTSDMEAFSADLATVSAGGGGDGPEDLQAALDDAIHQMEWRPEGIRLGFIITDAPPHLDYDQAFNYIDAALAAKMKAIKLFSIGTGGLDISGEYVLRQISQLTYAKYIFLHYGEKGESSGGQPGSVSHHTGANYDTDKLEAVIIRFAKEELSYLSEEPLKLPEDYFTADKIDDEQKEETLIKLFEKSISQLLDYATLHITKEMPTAVVPLSASTEALQASSEYFTEQLNLSLSKNKRLKHVERTDLQKIMTELGLQLSGLVDENKAAEAGKLMGAQLLITGTLFEKDARYEIYLKLLRTQTAEVLAVTKLKMDKQLGL